jgi:y4mF family transcriptional regulator
MTFTKIHSVKEIGQMVKDKRKKLGLRQADTAGLAGVGIRFLSELERGKETLAIAKVLQVANNLGLDIFLQDNTLDGGR